MRSVEVVAMLIIISALTAGAVEVVGSMQERMVLEYETRRLYSDLRRVQAMSATSTIVNTGLSKAVSNGGEKPALIIKSGQEGYQLFRGTKTTREAISEEHDFACGIKLTSSVQAITFNEEGKANVIGKVTLYTRRQAQSAIVLDSVGRIRATRP